MKSKLLIVLLLMLSLCSCDPRYGFIESEFNLSPESRLPKWVDIPSGFTRTDLTMTIRYYTHPILRKVTMVVKGPAPEHKVIMEVVGDQRYHPITSKQPRGVYPAYVIISANGIKEVFEHRAMEPIIYITDDPKVTSVLKKE